MTEYGAVSPSRRYMVIMTGEEGVDDAEEVILPESLPNTPASVKMYFQKYLPPGMFISEVHPIEATKTVAETRSDEDFDEMTDEELEEWVYTNEDEEENEWLEELGSEDEYEG